MFGTLRNRENLVKKKKNAERNKESIKAENKARGRDTLKLLFYINGLNFYMK